MINVFATPSRIPAMTCSGVWPTNSLSFASGSFSDASELNASTMSLMITALPPRFEPDAHRVLADDDGEDERHREFKRTEPVDERRRGRERRDRGRMAARHPAVADQARKVDALRHNGVNDRLDELRPEPRRETDEQKGIRQQFLKPIHMFPLPFAVRALSALECSLLYHRFPVRQ